MTPSILILVPLLALVLWIIAAIKMSQQPSGGIKFLKHFAAMLIILFLLYLMIIVPILNCRGLLCGIENVLGFLGIGSLMNFIWPIMLIVKTSSTTVAPPQKKKVVVTDILDDDFDLLDDLIK